MSWFRRLSRDRFSKYEPDFHGPEGFQARERALDGLGGSSGGSRPTSKGNARPNTSYGEQHSGAPTKDAQFDASPNMLRRQPAQRGAPPADDGYGSASGGGQHLPNGTHSSPLDPSSPTAAHAPSSSSAFHSAPDPLTRAFNEAIAPYHERLTNLQTDLERSRATVRALEADRAALHAWLDRRGLRPDLPPELAAALPDAASAVAAGALATQLDRKTTMLNFSLHQLADALPEGVLPTYTVASTLLSVTRQVRYLSGLPGGSAFAFEALVKLAGNFNSHTAGGGGGADADRYGEGAADEDAEGLLGRDRKDEGRAGVDDFYENLDYAMGEVVRKRLAAVREGEEYWDVDKDVRRLDKTAAFLKKELGIQRYFTRSLEAMRREAGRGGGAGGLGDEGLTRYSEESR